MSRTLMDVLGVVSPGMATLAEPQGALPYTKTLLPGGIAGVTGAVVWKKHPFLGFIAAESVGQNAYRLYRGQGSDRTVGLCNVAQAACAVAGSLAWKQHPFYGGLGGFVLGIIATSFVPGSNSSMLAAKLRR